MFSLLVCQAPDSFSKSNENKKRFTSIKILNNFVCFLSEQAIKKKPLIKQIIFLKKSSSPLSLELY